MSASAPDRVSEARRRRRLAESVVIDHVPLLVEVDSPRAADPPLVLGPRMTVIDGLSPQAVDALDATVAALWSGDTGGALDGTVAVGGELRPVGDVRGADQGNRADDTSRPKTELVVDANGGQTETLLAELTTLVTALERATTLLTAELRGAQYALEELSAATPTTRWRSKTDAELDELAETIAALDASLPNESITARLSRGLERLADAEVAHTGAGQLVEQARIVVDRLHPTDPIEIRAAVRDQLDAARIDLDDASAKIDVVRRDLWMVLAELGIEGDEPDALARRVLAERDELLAVRARLEREFHADEVIERTDGEPVADASTASQRTEYIRSIRLLRRRLLGHEHLVVVARQQWVMAYLHGAGVVVDADAYRERADRDDVRPLLCHEPLNDLPTALWDVAMQTVRRHSALTQVLVIPASDASMHWRRHVGNDALLVRAHGWFAGEDATSC